MENKSTIILDANQRVGSKFIARVFLYLFLGLGITAIVAFLFPVFARMNPAWFNEYGEMTESGASMILAVGIGACVVLLIDSIVLMFYGRKSGKAPWIPYIIYALAMGVALSLFLFIGVSESLMAQAFGLSSLVFGIMGLIGYFAKGNLTGIKFVALTLGILLLVYSIFFLIQYFVLLGTNQWEAYRQAFMYDIISAVIILIIISIVTIVDINNMRKMAAQGVTNNNIALLCAFNLYSDFIIILIKILYLLAISQNN